MIVQLLEHLAEGARAGGFVMPPLMLASALLWYALGERLWTLRRGARGPLPALIARARRGELAAHGVIGRAIHAGLEAAREVEGLRPRLALALAPIEDELGRWASTVRAIVQTAPLAGLLGTVAGMVETFDALGDMALHTQSGGIAGGISQALLTTQMGLAVAIPGLLLGRLLDRRQAALADELQRVRELIAAGEVTP